MKFFIVGIQRKNTVLTLQTQGIDCGKLALNAILRATVTHSVVRGQKKKQKTR